MQTELIRDIEPPSYEESVYLKQLVGKVKAQRRKTPPPSYDNNSVFDIFKQTQLIEKKGADPFEIGKISIASPSECSHDDENQQDCPMDVRLERVSSCLQQMIDAANQSLITSSTTAPSTDAAKTSDNDAIDDDATLIGDIANEQRMKTQQWRINRKKSLDRLKSSQDSLARTIDQLNLSITQHFTDKAASLTYNYTQHTHHHHHHHHYYYYYYHDDYYHQSNSARKQRAMSRKSSVSLWTSILTQAALVYGICHQLLSWSTPTSSIVSVAWFVTMLLIKRKSNAGKLGLIMSKSSFTEYSIIPSSANMPFYSDFKSSLLLRYSSLLSLFRKQ